MKFPVIAAAVTLVASTSGLQHPGRSYRPTQLSSAAADSVQAFVISSLGSTYPLAGRVVGRVTVGAESIWVQIDSGVVQNRMPALASGVTVVDTVELRSGIGAPDGDSWRVAAVGSPTLIAPTLAPGAAIALSSTQLAVARPAAGALSGRWLVLELRARHRGINGRAPGPFTSYICSDRDLEGPPTASASRAALLARAYNSAC